MVKSYWTRCLHCVPYIMVQERDVVLQATGLTWMPVAKQKSCISLATPHYTFQGHMQRLFVWEQSRTFSH